MTREQMKRRPSSGRWLVVLLCGILTTGISLWWFLVKADTYVSLMRWYVQGFVPVGAFMVGVTAGFGYVAGAWLSGARITGVLIKTVLALHLIGYVTAEYVEYRNFRAHLPPDAVTDSGQTFTFLRYYDMRARNFSFEQKNGEAGEPLGLWGYPLLMLSVLAFVAGGALPPGLMSVRPHCATCERYMTTREMGLIPASIAANKTRAADTNARQEREQHQVQASDSAAQAVSRLKRAASTGDSQSLIREVAGAPVTRASRKLPQRIAVNVVHCKGCMNGNLQLVLLQGSRRSLKSSTIDTIPLAPEVMKEVLRA